jgi:hypothetical protein
LTRKSKYHIFVWYILEDTEMDNFIHAFQSYTSDDGKRWFAADSSDSYPRLAKAAQMRSEAFGYFERVVNLEIGETLAIFQAGHRVALYYSDGVGRAQQQSSRSALGGVAAPCVPADRVADRLVAEAGL